MPELPEVESIRRSLKDFVINRSVVSVDVRLPKIVSGKGTKRIGDQKKVDYFTSNLVGKQIIGVGRRAKNLIIEISDGGVVVIHLKMTGQLIYEDSPSLDSKVLDKHTHIVLSLDSGFLCYNDVRQFGYVLYYDSIDHATSDGHFAGIGVEPLSDDFSLEYFVSKMRGRRGVLKKLFLDQKVVAGLGNIYSDEVCFDSGVRPDRRVESLTKTEIESIYNSIKKILTRAVEMGGSSVSDYVLVDGSRGSFASQHQVYNRGGKECYHCASELVKIEIGGRSTVYCPVDQK